jgi:hypothetical protein
MARAGAKLVCGLGSKNFVTEYDSPPTTAPTRKGGARKNPLNFNVQ